jgi:hypothetical protein
MGNKIVRGRKKAASTVRERQMAKAMLADVARDAVDDAFNKASFKAAEIGTPRTLYDFCRWLYAAIRHEVDEREEAIKDAPHLRRIRP